jgi:hypothetical protein
VDKEKLELVNGVDFLLRNPEVAFERRTRLAPLNITYQGDFADQQLAQVPAALEALLRSGNPELARTVLDKLHRVHEAETQSRNYAPGIQGHHSLNAANSYHLTSDFSVDDAQKTFDVGRANAIVHGTVKELILPETRIAHQRSHLDPISHKPNFSNYNSDYADPRLKAILEPEERALAALPMQRLQANYSDYVYNSPEERNVRRLAGKTLGITPGQLTSLLPNTVLKTPTGKLRKGTFVAAAKANLTQEIMDKIIERAYGVDAQVRDIVKPNQIVEILKTKGPRVIDRKGSPGLLAEAMEGYRPGQLQAMERFRR